MKLILLFIGVLLLGGTAFAQDSRIGSITVFSEGGENFSLFLNGEKKNDVPAGRVVAAGVSDMMVSMRIVFDNSATPEIKKNIMRQGKDCTYNIQKNKKGEYVVRVKECSGGSMATAPVADASSAAPTTGSSPLSANYADGMITLSDGRMLTVTKSKSSGLTGPMVIMKSPSGATATITYDDNTEKYTSEIPFQYEVKDYNNNNSYFRLTVDEGGADKTWHVRLQNGTGYQISIE